MIKFNAKIVKIGNSYGIIIPKAFFSQMLNSDEMYHVTLSSDNDLSQGNIVQLADEAIQKLTAKANQ